MSDTPAPATPAAPTPKKRSLGRRILRLFGILVVLFIVGLVVLYFMRNSLVVVGVQTAGRFATDQTTILKAADLSLAGGSLDLSQLQIDNPTKDQPFKEPVFLTMKNCNVSVDTGTLLSNTIVVPQIDISGLEITIEQQGAKNNLAVLMDIMKQKSAAASPPAKAGAPAPKSNAPEAPGRSLKISQIRLASTKVHLRGAVPMDLDLGTITIKDPTNPDGRPMKAADVMVTVLLNVAQGVVGNPQLPPEFKNGLADVSKFVANLDLGGTINQAGQALQGVTSQAGGAVNDLGKGVDDLSKGLGGLLGGGSSSKPATKP
jgi:hypothetical protein